MSFEYFKLFSAVYILIRGRDNISEYKKRESRTAECWQAMKSDLTKAGMRYLLGRNKGYRDKEGNSFYHLAVLENNIEIFDFLKAKKISHQLKNNNKKSPYDLAKELNYELSMAQISQLNTKTDRKK